MPHQTCYNVSMCLFVYSYLVLWIILRSKNKVNNNNINIMSIVLARSSTTLFFTWRVWWGVTCTLNSRRVIVVWSKNSNKAQLRGITKFANATLLKIWKMIIIRGSCDFGSGTFTLVSFSSWPVVPSHRWQAWQHSMSWNPSYRIIQVCRRQFHSRFLESPKHGDSQQLP